MIENQHQTILTKSKLTPFLVFRLDDAEYAIHVEHVREIITSVVPSPVPGAPDYLLGVINLRGKILPMVDLRRRFKLPIASDNERDCFIVLTIDIEQRVVELGVRVDAVCEVQRIAEDCIDSISDLADYSNDRLVFQGVAKTSSGVKMILDTRQLIDQLRSDVHLRLSGDQQSHYVTSDSSDLVTT